MALYVLGDYIFQRSEYRDLLLADDKSDVEAIILSHPSEDVEAFRETTFYPPLQYKIPSPFIVACYNNRLEIVEYLLENRFFYIDSLGYGGNPIDEPATTALVAACKNDSLHMDLVKCLVDEGANVNLKGDDGTVPLHHAYSLEVIKYLVEHGAKVNAVDDKGYTPLMRIAISQALITEKMEVAEYLLEKGARVDHCAKDGYTILHLSVLAGINLVQVLLQHGVNLWSAPAPSTTSSTDISYAPHFLYTAAIGVSVTNDINLYLQMTDCPPEVAINTKLIWAVCYSFSQTLPDYFRWMEALGQLKDSNISLSYPPPVEEYGGRVEVRTTDELDAIWNDPLEVEFQRVMILERCLGSRSVNQVMDIGLRLIKNGLYIKEGEVIIKRVIRLEESICRQILAQSPGSVCFPQDDFTESPLRKICDYSGSYVPDYSMFVRLGLLALKATCHLDEPVLQLVATVLELFSCWISSIEGEFPSSMIALAKELVSEFYCPDESNLLCSNVHCFFNLPKGPLLFQLLLEAGGNAAINEVVDQIPWMDIYSGNEERDPYFSEQTLLHRVLLGLYKCIEDSEIVVKVLEVLLKHGAHIDTTNSKGMTVFSSQVFSGLDEVNLSSYNTLCSSYLPLSLYCIAANAVVKHGVSYESKLPLHVVKFVRLHDRSYFKSFGYFQENIYHYFDDMYDDY